MNTTKTDTKSPSDEFCDSLIEMCHASDRPFIYERLIDKVLRPYLMILDNEAPGENTEEVGNAIGGMVSTMLTNFIARVVPKDDQAAAVDAAQILIDSIAASVSADVLSSYTEKRTQATIALEALRKKKGLLN